MADSILVRSVVDTGAGGARAAIARLRRSGWRIVEGTAAAALAWVIAVRLVHHTAPFFAPAAALIAIGVTRGQRIHRTVEIVVGVALGVLVADVIARALAPRLTLTIVLITGLTLVVATMVGGGPILSVQAAVSGIYVAVIAPPSGGLLPSRFVDALIGGGVALAVNQIPLPRSLPNRLLRGAAPVFTEIASVLEATAAALATHDPAAAREALTRARQLDGKVATFEDLAAVEAESIRFDPVRRRQRDLLRRYENAGRQLDLAARNVRVLARAGVFLTRGTRRAPTALARAVEILADAVRGLGQYLASDALANGPSVRRGARPGPDDPGRVADRALDAIRSAARVLEEARDVPVVMIVGQVRATAVDLMLGSGMAIQDVLIAADEALGEPDAQGA